MNVMLVAGAARGESRREQQRSPNMARRRRWMYTTFEMLGSGCVPLEKCGGGWDELVGAARRESKRRHCNKHARSHFSCKGGLLGNDPKPTQKPPLV